MKGFGSLLLLVFLTTFAGCFVVDVESSECSTVATLRDLTGLDGCGFVLELTDGTRLEPIFDAFFCGTPPLPEDENYVFDFVFEDGRRVLIDFVEVDAVTSCMVGKTARITCIRDFPRATD